MKKGITPIIAVIILLLITMALAATAWAFLSGFLSTMVGKSFMMADTTACATGGIISVYITNTGTVGLAADGVSAGGDVDVCLIDGASCGVVSYPGGTIQPGHQGLIATITTSAGTSHTVKIGIGSYSGTAVVSCP